MLQRQHKTFKNDNSASSDAARAFWTAIEMAHKLFWWLMGIWYWIKPERAKGVNAIHLKKGSRPNANAAHGQMCVELMLNFWNYVYFFSNIFYWLRNTF